MKIENQKNLNNYPIQYITPIVLKDGTLVQLRPIHPVDSSQAETFRNKLSDKSIRDRFLGYIPSISKTLVTRLTQIDYDIEMAIVAEVIQKDEKEAIAVARIVGNKKDTRAEFAIIIVDSWQGRGLGGKMTDYMIAVARDMEFSQVYALLYAHNTQMLEIFKRKGFKIKKEGMDTDCAVLDL